jgi:hypothetical protein
VGLGLHIFQASRSHSIRHTTLGMTPLDEGSARRRDLYPTIHNYHKRQTSVTPLGFEPTIPASKRAAAHPSLRPQDHWDRPKNLLQCSVPGHILVRLANIAYMSHVKRYDSGFHCTGYNVNAIITWKWWIGHKVEWRCRHTGVLHYTLTFASRRKNRLKLN